ncbi:hypothetical protein PNOK_0400000 [Pyrrhoderma noxium]|uniref:Uncharacterized protein n=1 Tax=Pyrrhoderma noxium TaxID=2282107 RepID=A0A286UP54_9AGAM|nr:hypothetical protein PNOK_0400000 [Pyrrhoderma noxium]
MTMTTLDIPAAVLCIERKPLRYHHITTIWPQHDMDVILKFEITECRQVLLVVNLVPCLEVVYELTKPRKRWLPPLLPISAFSCYERPEIGLG